MKSDQEFLKGVYEKAEELELSEEKEWTRKDSVKGLGRIIPIRYAVTAAAFIILVSASIFWHDINKKTEQITPQPMSINVRGIDLGNGLQLLMDSATDVLEVKQAKSGGNAYKIVKIYKKSGNEKDIISELSGKVLGLKKSQTAVIFLKRESGSTEVLDNYISTKKGSYRNVFGNEITKDELLEQTEK